MRRLRAAAAAAAALSVAALGTSTASASASELPTTPTAVTSALVDDGMRAASLDVAWVASTDADGAVASYLVQVGPAGSRPTSEVTAGGTTARVAGLVRGRTYDVRVIAVDDVGDRSLVGAPSRVEVPPLVTVLDVGVRARGGASQACRGGARPCTFEALGGAQLELRASPAVALAGVGVEIESSWRRPGTRRFVQRSRIVTRLGVAGDAVALSRIVRASGTWCVRSSIVGAPDLAAASAGPTCVRYRPPVEIGWAGDIVIGSSYGLPPNGGRDQFSKVSKLLRAPDLMIGNYEGTLSRGGSSRCSGGPLCFIFQAPPERARNLRSAGFDVMSLANNHGLDKGADARNQTVAALARVGIPAAGLPGRVTTVQVEDTRLAIVGFSPYLGTTSMRSPRAIRALVRAAAAAGDVVVVVFHAGLEGAAGAHVPRGADYGTQTRSALHAAVDAGADVVLGSGPHVVRGVERYRGSYIVYSAGNFAGWHNFGIGGLTAQSGVVRFTFDYSGHAAGGTWDGVVIDQPGVPRPDRSGAVVRRVASLSRADFGRRGARFSRDGRFR